MASKRHSAGLIFTPRNPLWSVKILVVDESPVFHLCGCYRCGEAREHPEWWREPRPGGGCWIVPQESLRAMRSAADVCTLDERRESELQQFSRDWRAALAEQGVTPPTYHPIAATIAAKHRDPRR
jgi:hypothetical protein